MPLPEGYLPREGDTLVIHAVVKYDVVPKEDAEDEDGPKVFLRPVGYYTDIRIPVKDCVGIFSRKWEVDERVQFPKDHSYTGTILAVHEGRCWVRLDGGKTDGMGESFMTVDANELEPYEKKEPA